MTGRGFVYWLIELVASAGLVTVVFTVSQHFKAAHRRGRERLLRDARRHDRISGQL